MRVALPAQRAEEMIGDVYLPTAAAEPPTRGG
jgi:hypothetical protein